ncbi:TPA: uracil-DNA glycosylase [Streptococcus pyogenes]|uniref:Uracil-DNA glycosylase n=1 Tax=Streptococcus anginosus TaxID=1328 RepID=A0A412PL36_STRAP|nr:uracil-DNA glycosylase [Streptococcus anginosus]MDU6600354.1 uracil-DNA glycosylase [Streptococcus anginosus]RGT59389.1 uracil-DNA glycosylase [Streptococcus anginosus]HEP3392815.1 uracil-DNA glycosylase [Streptococcus pyogenes]HES6653018.1 uracil-DNA glycosylase [Streptococcus pyogenes]
MKSLTEIAHDITVSLLPKSLDETMSSIWNEDKDHYTVKANDIIIDYAELHFTILERLKEEYGENGEKYPH